MDEEVVLSVLRDNAKYLFVTRGRSTIARQMSTLAGLDARITEVKEGHISRKDELNANKWLSMEHLCKSLIAGLGLFLELKNGDPDKAWSSLVGAQDHAYWSSAAYDLKEDLQKFLIRHFHNIEKVVFPPQTFLSTSMVVKKSLCGICDKPFHECDHLPGEPYMGRLCMKRNVETGPIHHVSIVGNPANKRCRITHLTNHTKTNLMTLEIDQTAVQLISHDRSP